MFNRQIPVMLLLLSAAAVVAGCAGSPQSTVVEQFYETPGQYPAAPAGTSRPRVAVATPAVQVTEGAASTARLPDEAYEQLFWTADRGGRFNLLDRQRLDELARRQGHADLVAPGELLHPAALPEVDAILICRISGLSIRGGEQPTTVSVANVEKLLHVSKPEPRLTTRAVVEMRLVRPGTGVAAASAEDHFNRICSPSAMGLQFSSPDEAWGELHLSDEQMTQVLRLVIDDGLRKLLPQADAWLKQSPTLAAGSYPSTGPSARPGPANSGVAKIRCPECGFEASVDDEFCPNCGARLLQNGVRLKPAGK